VLPRIPTLVTAMMLSAGILLQSCGRKQSTITPNLSDYGSQLQGGARFELEARGNRDRNPPSGTLMIWTPDYQGMNPLTQKKIDATLTDLIDRFESRYDLVTVIWKKHSDSIIYKEYSDKIKNGLGPDLILTHNFMIPQLSDKKEISPIPADLSRLHSIRPKLLRGARINGELYAVPFILDVQLLCYDKRKMSTPPATLQQMVALSKSGISTAIGGNFLEKMWGLPGFSPSLFGEKKPPAATLKAGLTEWMKTLQAIDSEPNLALFENSRVMTKYFSEGKISLMNCASIDLPFLRARVGADNLGISTLPSINGQPAQPRLTGASFAANPYMSNKQKDLAFRFTNFAISTDQQQQIAINWNSLLPVNENSDFNKELLPVLKISEDSFRRSFQLTKDELEILAINFDSIQELFEDATSGLIDPAKASTEIIDQLEIKQ